MLSSFREHLCCLPRLLFSFSPDPILLMATEVTAQFDDPRTTATYLGEAVGTHYSAALRAALAYGKHLAGVSESLLEDTFEGEGLRKFWLDLIASEEVGGISPSVLATLSSTSAHYFRDFLGTAEAVYERKYREASPARKKKLGQTEHARCLRLLRDHKAEGLRGRFAVQNTVSKWMQLSRITRAYRE